MSRPLHAATKASFCKSVVPFAIIMYLDIVDDPLIIWTGLGNLTFAPGETGDPSLDGKTFVGSGLMAEIGAVSDGVGGSDALQISLPGVDINEPMLRQLITNRNRWQFRRAVVWGMTLDPDTDEIVGKPFRLKTGRMDQMPFSDDNGKGVVKCKIEGQQAYGNTPLGTRYSEIKHLLNSTDTSQDFAHSLANMSAELGKATGAQGGAQGGPTIVGGGMANGGSGSGREPMNRHVNYV